MRVEVTKTMIKIKETVEVSLPYYYKHDLKLDQGNCVIYGKIDDKEHVSIKISDFGVEIEKEPTNWQSLSCYLDDEHLSDANEYSQAKAAAMNMVQSA